MTKRVLVLLIIPLLLFCGCGGNSKPRLSDEEYKNEIMSAWEEFRDAQGEYLQIAMAAGDDFSIYRGRRGDLQKAVDTMRSALERYAEMNPPEDFEERHKKLLISIEDEKRWLSYREQSYNADTEEESNEALDKIAEEVYAMNGENTFPHLFIEIYRELGGFDND